MTSKYMANIDVTDLVEKKSKNDRSTILFSTPTTILVIIFMAWVSYYSVHLSFALLMIFAISIYCYIVCNPEVE